MALPIEKRNDRLGIEPEVTEGTLVVPSAATSYVRCLDDSMKSEPSRELLERSVVTGNLGRLAPKKGMKSTSVSFGIELRGADAEGGEPDHHQLLKNALGSSSTIATANTARAVATSSTVIPIEAADIGDYAVNDIVLIKESGAYEVRPISVVTSTGGSETITFPFALDNGAPATSVVVSKSQMYRTADSGHTALSVCHYIGNQKRYAHMGCKVASMSLENFAAGQLATLSFQLAGINYTHIDGAAPHTPTYDSVSPVCGLSAYAYRDGVAMQLSNFSLSLSNSIAEITDLTNANGKAGLLMGKPREISGTMNPYMDDTTVDRFNDWNAGTEVSIFVYGYVPSATAGEITLGSVVAFWMPNCVLTEAGHADTNGLITDELSYRTVVDPTGVDEELIMAII